MKILKKYLDDRKVAINTFLEQPRHEYTPETFHKLRVEIKKLNALFDLIVFCSKDFKRKKTFKPFRKVFRQAGKVREFHIEEATVQNFCDNKCLIDYQNKLILQKLEEDIKFFLLIKKKLINRFKKKFKVINSFLSDVNKKKSNKYLDKKINQIKSDLDKKTIPPKRIHELRKLVKLYIYNTESLDNEKEESFLEKKALAELLGKWHDLRVIIRRLDKVKETKKIKPEEVSQLESVIIDLKGESELLFVEINLAMLHSRSEKSAISS